MLYWEISFPEQEAISRKGDPADYVFDPRDTFYLLQEVDMNLVYLRLLIVSISIYSTVLTLNLVRDYLVELESGRVIAIGLFIVLSIFLFTILFLIDKRQNQPTFKLDSNATLISSLIFDFLGGFTRGYKRS